MKSTFTMVPTVGIGYRFPLHHFITDNLSEIDVLEVNLDQYFAAGRYRQSRLEPFVGTIPLIGHSVGLSLGTDVLPDIRYLEKISLGIEQLQIPFFSEHLGFTKSSGLHLGSLLPVPRTEEAAEVMIRNVMFVKARLPVPLYLENISYYFEYPESDFSEEEFINLVCREAGVSVMLDLQNLYVNSVNHSLDPHSYIDSLPTGLVKAMHTAGGRYIEDVLIDDHGHAIADPVLDLVEYALERQNPQTIIVERDNRIEETDEILNDIRRLKARVEHSTTNKDVSNALAS
jgi:uncharacterized protein